MNKEIKDKLFDQFTGSDQAEALAELESITLQHVMANSQTNLDNTWIAILELSKGDLAKLKAMVKAAKEDFRDVIYWASLNRKNT